MIRTQHTALTLVAAVGVATACHSRVNSDIDRTLPAAWRFAIEELANPPTLEEFAQVQATNDSIRVAGLLLTGCGAEHVSGDVSLPSGSFFVTAHLAGNVCLNVETAYRYVFTVPTPRDVCSYRVQVMHVREIPAGPRVDVIRTDSLSLCN